jgi:hypothetical protein
MYRSLIGSNIMSIRLDRKEVLVVKDPLKITASQFRLLPPLHVANCEKYCTISMHLRQMWRRLGRLTFPAFSMRVVVPCRWPTTPRLDAGSCVNEKIIKNDTGSFLVLSVVVDTVVNIECLWLNRNQDRFFHD